MKLKVFITCIAVAISTVVQAGQIVWGASGFSQDFNGGKAYLVQMISGSHTIDDIVNSLSNDGITDTEKADFKYWEPVAASEGRDIINDPAGSSGYYVVYNITVGGNVTPSSNLDNFFVVAINGDSFAISGFFNKTDYISADTPCNITIQGPWQTGTLGNGDTPVDPDVPEPTALALLALGVAGVALRRRVA